MNYKIEIQGHWARKKSQTKATRGRPRIYPFQNLKVGGHFTHPNVRSAVVLAYYWNKKLGHRYEVNQLGCGAVVARVA
jgi:hypothetical protein